MKSEEVRDNSLCKNLGQLDKKKLYHIEIKYA